MTPASNGLQRPPRVTQARLRAFRPSRSIAGVRFDALRCNDVIDVVADAVRRRRRLRLSFANAEFVIERDRNTALQQYLDDCDLVLADGSSIVTASRLTGDAPPLPTRVTGTDFVDALGEASAATGSGWRSSAESPAWPRRPPHDSPRSTPARRWCCA